ncbi:uncharacterized protein LOC128515610 [Clarias gariepinus]|uniref:uncharacterized protein LOC128515610 n=1 Tax=Clarias gariepinus TaxID=13013 RepID=UPI00234C9473|nr:uncharacterized protein LOC128515610 [Clarias gariepinus]
MDASLLVKVESASVGSVDQVNETQNTQSSSSLDLSDLRKEEDCEKRTHERQEDGKVLETDKKDHQISHEEGEEEKKPKNELKEEDMASAHENCGQERNEHEVAEEKLENVQQVTFDPSPQLDPDGDVNKESAEDEHIKVEQEDKTLCGNLKDNMKIEEKEVDEENKEEMKHPVVEKSLEVINNIKEMGHESSGQYEEPQVLEVKEEDKQGGFVGAVMLEVENIQDVGLAESATGVGETEEMMEVDDPNDAGPIVNVENHTNQSWEKEPPAYTQPEHFVHPEIKAEKRLEPATSSSPLVEIKDEPMDEEYEKALDPQAPAGKIKDEPDTSDDFGQKASEQIKISAVFSVGESSTALGSPTVAPAANVPPSTSAPLLTLSGSSLCLVCSGCKKILLKGQTAFQRKGSSQLYCSPRCLCSSTFADCVPLPITKKTCHYCLKVIPNPKDIILAPVDSTKAVKEFCSQKCLSTFNSKRESATSSLTTKCGMCQKACTIRYEVNFMGNIQKLCSDACFQQFRSSNKLSLNCCITCGSYCYSDGKSPSLLVDGTVKKFCSHRCVSTFKKELSSEVESAARALIDVLARGLAPSSSSGTGTLRNANIPIRENLRLSGTSGLTPLAALPEPENRVKQALRRQFPSMFGTENDQPRGKKRFSFAKPGIVKKTDFQIYVLPKPTLFTPKEDEALDLVHAGLGKRLLTVPDNFKHSEIVILLEEEFPKLKVLQGGWMFYKSKGGGGRRKLSIIPTDSDGYSTRLLKSVSNNGKNMLFVVPLQEQLSIEPLPFDSVEFAKMPQSNCMKCGRKIPLPLLPLHIKECKVTQTESVTDVTVHDDDDENVSGATDQPSSLLHN